MDSPVADCFLPDTLTIETADALVEQLKQLPVTSSVVTLDAAHTEVLTTPGVQVLLSFAKMLEVKGAALSVKNAQPAFSHSFFQLGLAHHLLQWEAN